MVFFTGKRTAAMDYPSTCIQTPRAIDSGKQQFEASFVFPKAVQCVSL